ncbi:MYG1 protein C27H6.8 isoform X2 [Hetaerina americana]|uniref:MYG1 protein C27H6.8 isoform X2 n=1 Tax=Hetaerina americana TaxID=62018 RepID=UPI003A7F48EC
MIRTGLVTGCLVTRTRDQEELNKCDIVIDVGGVYDHSKRRYDHHQKSFEETLCSVNGGHGVIKLSSAGLVWAHYGELVLKAMVKQNLTEAEYQEIYHHMYRTFVVEIDAKDNGIEPADPPFRYQINTDLSSRVSRLNMHGSTSFSEDIQFSKAVEMVGKEFTEVLEDSVTSWLPSKQFVAKAIEKRFSVDASGQVIKFERGGISWPLHLKALEDEMDIHPKILFVLFPDANRGWRVQAVSSHGFILRKQVLKEFMGLRDQELVAASGIKSAIFVHSNGFIGGAETYEDVLKMAQDSLDKELDPTKLL